MVDFHQLYLKDSDFQLLLTMKSKEREVSDKKKQERQFQCTLNDGP